MVVRLLGAFCFLEEDMLSHCMQRKAKQKQFEVRSRINWESSPVANELQAI